MRIGSIYSFVVSFLILCLGSGAILSESYAQTATYFEQDLSVEDEILSLISEVLYIEEEGDKVQDVEYSVEHGFYDTPFELTLSTPTAGAQICYSLDGSTPTPTTGTIYRGPFTIDSTTVIRSLAFRESFQDSNVVTRTYIFVSDVIAQSMFGEAPGPDWPSGSVNGQIIDYGMDPDVIYDPRYNDLIDDALLSIPSISIVTDLYNLFDPSTGIYVNALHDGRDWERPTSLELINPDGSEGFQINAGLRIRGGWSRQDGCPKHAFRFYFRSEYGETKLRFALFGDEGVNEFDCVDFTTAQNFSWSFKSESSDSPGSRNTFLREVFSRDLQREMGQPYTRSRYYHLYINGQYWGLYLTQERSEASYAESYFGGDKVDYDVVKIDAGVGRPYTIEPTDGNLDACYRLWEAALAGFDINEDYYMIQGLNPDGSFNSNLERLVDIDNLIDYMIDTFYVGDPDGPIALNGVRPNNYFCIYNRTNPDGFKFFRHDAEWSMFDLYENRTGVVSGAGGNFYYFNPQWLHHQFIANLEYRMLFADHVHQFFFNNAVLTPDAAIGLLNTRKDQIELAIIAESARWGDAKALYPRTKDDHWIPAVNYLINDYLPYRTDIVLQQFKDAGLYPTVNAPVFFVNDLYQHGGHITNADELSMSAGDGTIYYTLDGSDPRLRGGRINPNATILEDNSFHVTLVSSGSNWRYKDDGSDQGTAWRYLDFDDDSWAEGPAQLGYGENDEATVIGYGPDPGNKYTTTYFRHLFNIEDPSSLLELSLYIMRDDGAVVYINGIEAVRTNMPNGDIDYLTWAQGAVGGDEESTFFMYDIDPDILVDGINIIAVEVHQINGISSDASFDLEIAGIAEGPDASSSIILDCSTTVKARTYDAGQWSALTEARFTVGLEGLVINEFMASNQTILEDPDEADEFPDWIELYNGTSDTINLEGMYLSDKLQNLRRWQIGAGVSIDPGQYLIFYADDDGTQGVYHTNFQLNQNGEAVVLVDSDGKTIIDSIVFDLQFEDISYGRFPDGFDSWDFRYIPTPGLPNQDL